jgi:hypothetical protein
MCYAKVLKKGTHESPKILKKNWAHEGPSTKKWWAHEGSGKKRRDNHVLKIKLMRVITHTKEYSIDLSSYPHTSTSWSKGMTSFSLDPSFDLTKYAE